MSNITSTKVITGKVRLSYCHIFEPKTADDGRQVWSTALIISKSDTKTISAIRQAIEMAKKDGATRYWGGKIPHGLWEALRDGDSDRPEDPAYRDAYFVNCKSYTKPGVIDRNRQVIMDPQEIYSGCYVYASISFYPFNKSGNRGIACGLNNIMKCCDGDYLGGRVAAEDDFADFRPEEDDDLLG